MWILIASFLHPLNVILNPALCESVSELSITVLKTLVHEPSLNLLCDRFVSRNQNEIDRPALDVKQSCTYLKINLFKIESVLMIQAFNLSNAKEVLISI